jgi:hypothetical protein
MLLIDSAKCQEWIPKTEDEFEQVVKENAQDIFGEQFIYLEAETKISVRNRLHT